MAITLPLETMTLEEKLTIVETVWASIAGNQTELPVPESHLKLLTEREAYVASGNATFYSLDNAKEILRNRIKK